MVWLSWLRRDQTTRWNTLLPTCWKTTQRRNKPRPKTNAEKKKKKKRRTFLTNIKGINPFASVLLTTTRRRRRYHREDGKHLFNLLVGRRRMFVIVGGSGRGRRKKVTLIWFVILINIAIYAWEWEWFEKPSNVMYEKTSDFFFRGGGWILIYKTIKTIFFAQC